MILSVDAMHRIKSQVVWLFKKKKRAGDGTQTRDPQLGRLMLYQLSYSRFYFFLHWSEKCGESRIRTYEGVRQQIYSLPQLATLVSPQSILLELK